MFLVLALALGSASAQQFEPLTPSFSFLLEPPAGMPPMLLPSEYAPTEPMFELGRQLFHDGILSRDQSVSCATCHPAAQGFASPQLRPQGIGGQLALRHAPALWNRGWTTHQRWDGSSPSLEAFVIEPIGDAREMGFSIDEAIARLAADERYRQGFEQAFGATPSREALQRSLATFVRGIVAGDAPYDRFLRGDVDAMTRQQRHGQWIFESKGGCWQCHTPPLFTDEKFHNTGVGLVDGEPEAGRFAVTADPDDRGRWKTPTLRAVRLTAPFMHDGSLATLEDVVAFYERGGNQNEHVDKKLHALELTDKDRAALLAFLRSL